MTAPTSRPVLFSFTILLIAIASAVMLTGCVSTAGISPTHALLKPSQLGAVAAPTTSSQGADAAADASGIWPQSQWWTTYNDPVLTALIDKALVSQPSLQTVQARLLQAQATIDAQRSTTSPQVTGSADFTDQRYTENGIIPPPLAGSIRWSADARLGIGWDLDLAGGKKAALEAAIGQQRAALAESQVARLALTSNVTAAYVGLARLVSLRDVAARGLNTRSQVLDLVQQRIGAGLDTTVDLRQAQSLIAQSRVEVESIDESIARARHALAELTGQGPDALATLTPALREFRSTRLPQGLPADLIGRRPDLVAARWRVEAAAQDVQVARSQFYPNVNLMAFVGLSSIGLDNFIKSGSQTYGAGPAIRLPIFDAGRLRAGLKQRAGEVDVAVDSYNASLLRALREVADEVTTLQSLERQQRSQDDALVASESAFELATQRYRAGLGNLLVVLTAESTMLVQWRATAELKARHLGSEVALIRALGGGFRDDDTPGPSPIASKGAEPIRLAQSTQSNPRAAAPIETH